MLCVQTESKKTNDDDYDEYEDDFEVHCPCLYAGLHLLLWVCKYIV